MKSKTYQTFQITLNYKDTNYVFVHRMPDEVSEDSAHWEWFYGHLSRKIHHFLEDVCNVKNYVVSDVSTVEVLPYLGEPNSSNSWFIKSYSTRL